MFDWLLRSKFYRKSKMAIKDAKMRLEMIKKKRAAIDLYLRKDIADLLKIELDIDAYGRAEGLLVERNKTSCYDFVDQFCGCISSSHIAAMQKQSECPEDCREAVSSLMYAAARFADLPELQKLRTLFREKYGNSLDSFVNEEFEGRFRSKPPPKDMKLQVMGDIAAEFCVDWNSKALEQKLFNRNSPKQGNENEDKRKPRIDRETERNEKGLISFPREGSGDNLEKSSSSSSKDDVTEEYGKTDMHGPAKLSSSSSSSPSYEEVMQKRPPSYRDINPPYIINSKADTVDSVQDKPKPRSVLQRRLEPPPGNESAGYESGAPRVKEVDREEKEMDKQSPYKIDAVVDKHAPARESSLPLETTTPEEEIGKGHCRSASLQPDMLAGHVHPNLPNYDDLVAMLAGLRGR